MKGVVGKASKREWNLKMAFSNNKLIMVVKEATKICSKDYAGTQELRAGKITQKSPAAKLLGTPPPTTSFSCVIRTKD